MPVPRPFRAALATALATLAGAWLGCAAGQAEPDGPTGLAPAVEDRAAADGVHVAQACRETVGACQVLEVEVRGGYVETIFLPGGGHLELDGAELAPDGSARGDAYRVDEGYTGDVWRVTLRAARAPEGGRN